MAEYDPGYALWYMYKYNASGIGAGDYRLVALPRLGQNQPNPLGRATRIEYSLPRKSKVKLLIHDQSGKLVRTLENAERPAGKYLARWDARDSRGRLVADGTYYYVLDAGGDRAAKKMVVVR